jgi:hypothetical protein
MPVILASPETEIRRITVQGQPRQEKRDLISKYPTQKRVGGVTQVVKCLPRKCESLNSNPHTTHTHTNTHTHTHTHTHNSIYCRRQRQEDYEFKANWGKIS